MGPGAGLADRLAPWGGIMSSKGLVYGFLAIEQRTTRVALVAAVVFLALASALAFYQVITRFAFNAPSSWSEVASRSLIIWSVFLGAAAAFRNNEMMRVEVIFGLVPQRWHWLLETLIALLCLLFFLLLAWFSAHMGYRVRGQTLAGMDMSIAWAYAALPVGSVFCVLAVVARLLDRATRSPAGGGDPQAAPPSGWHEPTEASR